MALPLPLLEARTASRTLLDLWHRIERSLPDPSGAPPGLIVALPPAWANKYQILLYGQAARHRFATAGLVAPETLRHVAWPGPVILHAHWFAALFYGALSEADAGARLDRACAELLAFRDRTGARLVWTAHNVFPHGNAYPQTFLRLRQWIFENFDAVHVMQPGHVRLLEEMFERPAPPSFVVPHMTYDGVVPDSVDPVAARAQFGLPQDAFVFGSFGSLQGYKNLPGFLEAFSRLADADPRPMAALLGGIPTDSQVALELDRRWGRDPRVVILPRKIEDHEIQYLHRAADVMVLPYLETLNSGAALMAVTFDKPFLIPEGTGTDVLDGLGAIRFARTGCEGLLRAMAACLDTAPPAPDPQARRALAPGRVSDRFMTALRRLTRPD